MTLSGGLRARLIHDNTYNMVHTALTALGWFASGRHHAPLNFVAAPVDEDVEVPLNTLALVEVNTRSKEWETGSNLSEFRSTMYIDLYADSASLGTHLSHDIADILSGRLPSIGRTAPDVAVYDLSVSTPVLLFYCQVEDVTVDRAQQWSATQPWKKHWNMVRFDVVFYYATADDSLDP